MTYSFISGTVSQKNMSGLRIWPSSSMICSSPRASPACRILLMARSGVNQARMPQRSHPMAMGSTMSAQPTAVGVMNRSHTTTKGTVLPGLVHALGLGRPC